MLSGTADIVFLFDQSSSGSGGVERNWMADIAPVLESHLTSEHALTNNRYGLVVFGKGGPSDFARSKMLLPNNVNSQFGSAAQFEVAAGSVNVDEGGIEDGWDAIEHAINEYEYRPGAAVIFVLVQNISGRNALNNTLTHAGTLAAIASHNATLMSVVQASFDANFSDTHVFGVEADPNPLDTNFNQVSYVDDPLDPDGYSEEIFVDSANGGSNVINGADAQDIEPGDTDDDYVRLGWETGGSSWNIGVVQQNFDRADQQESDRMDAFNEAFLEGGHLRWHRVCGNLRGQKRPMRSSPRRCMPAAGASVEPNGLV